MTIDFTSARFLAIGTPPAPAAYPNLGKPALLAEPPGAARLAATVAMTQGAGAGLIARSTLHALLDILAVGDAATPVLMDEHCYPITRWAARAVREEGTMYDYRHRDVHHVEQLLAQLRRPAVVVADAWCAGCLRPAPLWMLADAARSCGGYLVVDDSLAFGVLGRRGMGTPSWCGLPHSSLLWLASAGKAFGTPLALITGPRAEIDRIRRLGPLRTHGSPASTADIAALASELADARLADRRRRLNWLVRRLRQGVASFGLRTSGWPLPVVGVLLPDRLGAGVIEALHRRGIDVLPVRSHCRRKTVITLCVRADHTEADVDTALTALHEVFARAA